MDAAGPQAARAAETLPPLAPTAAPAAWPGYVALLAAATLWSLNGPLIKLLSASGGGVSGAPGMTIACYRSLLGGLLFLPLAWRGLPTLRRVRAIWPISAVITFSVMTGCFVTATTLMAASSAIILQYLSPLVVFLLSPLVLGVRPRPSEGLVLLLAMLGVAVIFFGHERGATGALILAIMSGVGYGGVTLTLRGLRAVDATVVVAMNFLGSGVLMAAAIPFTPDGTFLMSRGQFALVALMSVVQFGLPYILFTWALQRVEAHRAALITLLEPVLNAILTYLIVGEAVPTPTLIGGPMILASVLGWMLLTWRREARQAA